MKDMDCWHQTYGLIRDFTTIKFTVISHSSHSFPSAPYQLSPVPVNEFQLAMLYPVKDGCTFKDIHDLAHTMIDTLSMEALTHVQIAYSDLIPDLHALPSAYKQTALALRVEIHLQERDIFSLEMETTVSILL